MLVVWKLDRLGRNLAHLVNTVQDLPPRGVGSPGMRRRRRTKLYDRTADTVTVDEIERIVI